MGCSLSFVPAAKHAQRVAKHEDKVNVPFGGGHVVNFEGLEFPVHPRQIHKFEKKNATTSVNVYMLELLDKALRDVPAI